jgi:pilus assembly protein CpaB
MDARVALRGAMVRESLDAGRPFTAAQLLRPGDRGFLAAVLAPGMRAVSVAVDAVSGTAGLIWPGDRVDVILTQAIEDAAQPMGRRIVGERVVRDVRVIAVDQELIQGGQQSQPSGGIANNNRVLTLEVAENTAERVAVATRLGRLVAVVRSAVAASAPEPAPGGTVWAGDVSRALRPSSVARPAGEMRVFRGGAEQPVTVRF